MTLAASDRRQPSALYVLSLIELFERLAFGAVLPFFALYLHEHHDWSPGSAIALSSGFLATSYLASLPGGYLADRMLGTAWAVFVGLSLMSAGFLGLAVDRPAAFWPALAALIIGQGLFKPSITTLLGNLYPSGGYRREVGFFIFYVAVNLGAFIGPLLAEAVRIRWGWASIFACAGIAMLPALMLFVTASVTEVSRTSRHEPTNATAAKCDERERSRALLLICGVAVVFWLAFQQTATALAFFAEQNTLQTVAILRWSIALRPGHFAALHAALVIGLTPMLLWMIRRLRAQQAEPSAPQKMIWGFVFTAAAFALLAWASLREGDSGRVSPLWLGCGYIFLAIGELLLSPMGLSLVTELAPKRLASRFTGLWFACIALGHGLAGAFGVLWGHWPHHRYFALLALLALGASAVLLSRLRALEGLLPRPARPTVPHP